MSRVRNDGQRDRRYGQTIDLGGLSRTEDGRILPPDDVEPEELEVTQSGVPLPQRVKERIAALLITTDAPYAQIARTVGVSWHSVAKVARELQETQGETLALLREEQKRDWAREAWQAAKEMTRAAVKGARQLVESEEPLKARDVRDLSVAAGIMVDKTALVLGEGSLNASGGGSGRDIAEAVMGAWEAGKEAGRREATPKNVTDV